MAELSDKLSIETSETSASSRSKTFLTDFSARLAKGYEAAGAVMFMVLFATVILQIASRYLFNNPTAWTTELASAVYIWVLFFVSAFVIPIRQHVVFDFVYQLLPDKVKRWCQLLTNMVFILLFCAVIPSTFSYFQFLGDQSERTAVMEISFQVVFFMYFAFVVVFPIRLALRLRQLLGPNWEKEL